jgi:hypothetical protein
MTDREPDDLFDALRDRLADYGQEPPAPLWAGIRAQLPPPLAPPQLRPKRRRRVPVGLLLFVLMMSGGLSWYWWQTQRADGVALKNPASAAQYSSAARPNRARSGQAAGQSAQNDADRGRNSILLPANQAPTIENLNSADSNSYSEASSSNSAVRNPIAKTESFNSKRGKPITNTENPSTSYRKPVSSTGKSDSKTRKSITKAGNFNSGPENPIARAVKSSSEARNFNSRAGKSDSGPQNSIASVGKGVTTPAKSKAKTREALVAARSTAARKGQRKAAATPALMASGRASKYTKGVAGPVSRPLAGWQNPARVAATASPLAAPPARTGTAGPAAAASASPSTAAAAPGAVVAAHPSLAPGTGEPAGQAGADALGYLLARGVVLQMPGEPALPNPQLVATTPPVPPAPFLLRWSVQVLAGPALTYRQLSAAPVTNTLSPMPTLTNQGSPNRNTNVAALERPALGSGFQLNVRRALTERWNLSLGLGYAEFATRLALQQVHGAPTTFDQDSASTGIHRRDAYRFVTLPVRLGYSWALSNRWRVGVLAGVDAAFYVGGSSTEGSACACQSQTWGASDSPYRRVSVGASLGAEVRYRLSGRWELLAQPTATYLLTPLAKPTTAYYQRHLFGGTALLGAAYTLP